MTLLQIRDMVKQYLDDPSSVLFTEAQYNAHINESYRSCFAFLNKVKSTFGRKDATGTLSAGTSTLAFPTDFLSVYKFGTRDAVGDEYNWMEYVDYEKYGEPSTDDETGEPVKFTIDFLNSRFTIYPTTDQAYLYKLIYRRKLIATDEMSADGNTPSLIPLDYHRWIVYETVLDALPTDDRKFNDVKNLQEKLEQRIKTELTMMQQVSPEYLRGWNGRNIIQNGQ